MLRRVWSKSDSPSFFMKGENMRLELYTIDQKLPRLIIYLLLGNNWTTYKGELNHTTCSAKIFQKM